MISRRSFIKQAVVLGTTLPLSLSANKSFPSLKFIHLTDAHMDIQDEDSVDAMKLMVKFINKNYKDLDFVCFGGDNFNNNVKGNKDALLFKEIIDTLHCPTLLVRGNKEANPNPNDDINLEQHTEMFLKGKNLKIVGRDWIFEKNGYIFLGLDSNIEHQNNGKYTQETLSFAEKMLKLNKPTVILNHHPYTNYWKGTDEKDIHKYVLNNSKEVIEKLFKYKNLLLTLSGHKHIDSVTNINGTKAIVTRGFVRPLDLDMYPMRYIELNSEKIEEKLIYTS